MNNKSEKEIAGLKEDFLIFLDEVGDPFLHRNLADYDDPSRFPVLTVTAVIISRAVYHDILMPGLDEIKFFFFRDTNIHLHSRELRRKDGIFKCFLDTKIYAEFKNRINALLERSSITTVSSSIHKIRLLKKAQKFEQLSGVPYNIGDIYLRNVGYVLERTGHFLKSKTGKVIFETQGKRESRRIQAVLTDARTNGTFYCPKERFAKISQDISFFTKKENINGLQIADYCTYPFARHAKNPKDDNNKFFDILHRYVYQGDFGEYGLKEWP